MFELNVSVIPTTLPEVLKSAAYLAEKEQVIAEKQDMKAESFLREAVSISAALSPLT